MKNLIRWMYDNKFFIKDGMIYDNIDGCRKQYQCKNLIWLLYALEFIYRVMIDICINAPGHEIIKKYGINGSKRKYLEKNVHDRR